MRWQASRVVGVSAVVCLVACAPGAPKPRPTATDHGAQGQHAIDLAQALDTNQLRVINRNVVKIPDRNGAVRVSEAPGVGLVWIEGTDFRSGTIELEVRGKDIESASFLGIAFHRQDGWWWQREAYEGVYLRPFNFRATDPARRQHAVQYIKKPEFDWSRLRADFPEEFENPVHESVVPTDWVKLRVVVAAGKVQIYVGAVAVSDPANYRTALDVRKLGQLDSGQVGLWVEVGGGDFANLVITPAN
jgi:hypothetical protein